MDEPVRLLPEGMYAIYASGDLFIQYEPSECDSKLLSKNLMRFSDKRLDGVLAPKQTIEYLADHMMVSPRHFLNNYYSFVAIKKLEDALENDELDRLFDAGEPSSDVPVPGALTSREAVQEEVDALRERFGINQPIRAHFVEKMKDYFPDDDDMDAATSFRGLPFLPNPYLMEIVFEDAFLTYPSRYREYLLLHEFAHCVQVLDAWPYYDEKEAHHDESYNRACAKIGFEPIEGRFCPAGSYRIICQRCGATTYTKHTEDEIDEFTRRYDCSYCLGPLRAERTDTPIVTFGLDVFEVGPDGDSYELIGQLPG